jgi:small subunit ribosomal protein S17e
VNRIKRLSFEALEDHKSKFGEDFAENKKVLNQICIVRSKSLKNEITGYITRLIKKENREAKSKRERISASQPEEQEVQVKTPEPTTSEEISEITIPESEPTVVSDESPSEVVTEAAPVDESTEEKTE